MSTDIGLLGPDGLDSLEGSNQPTQQVASISASQSLNSLSAGCESIATGLPRLDKALAVGPRQPGGIARGKVTEIFGPPGAGKTSLALNIARSALSNGKVVWIDTGALVPSPRLREMSIDLDNLVHLKVQTLAHLLALLKQPPKGFPPPGTHLIVIDSVSDLFNSYFPRMGDLKTEFARAKPADKPHRRWLLNRKPNVANDLATYLGRLATKNLAVLAVNQTQTRIKMGQPAVLVPALSGGAWEKTIQTRIAVCRALPAERFVEIEKLTGKTLHGPRHKRVIPFWIHSDGIRGADLKPSNPVAPPPKFSEPDYDEPTKEAEASSPLSSVLSSVPPSPSRSPSPDAPILKSPLQDDSKHGSPSRLPTKLAPPEEPLPASNKRKVEEIADSQDEDSGDEIPWSDIATLHTNQP